MPKRGQGVMYGVTFDCLDDKILTQALVHNIANKTLRNAGDVVLCAMVEYNKLFDDKGNRI